MMPTVPFVDLARQHAPIADELRQAYNRVVGSSAFVLGDELERFESEFASYCGADHCVGVGSGTAALTVMLQAAGVGANDEVIVPAHTFVATALAVRHAGAIPVYVDVDYGTGLIEHEAVEAAIGPATVAVAGRPPLRPGLRDGSIARARRASRPAVCSRTRPRPTGRPIVALAPAGSGMPRRSASIRARTLVRSATAVLSARATAPWPPEQDACATWDATPTVCTSCPATTSGWTDCRPRSCARSSTTSTSGLARAARLPRSMPSACVRTVELLAESPDSPCTYHVFPIRVSSRDRVRRELGRAEISTRVHYPLALPDQPALGAGPPVTVGSHGERLGRGASCRSRSFPG